MHARIRTLAAAGLAAATILWVACGGKSHIVSPTGPTTSRVSLEVTCDSTTVSVYGPSAQCKAMVNGTDETQAAVWSTSAPATASLFAGAGEYVEGQSPGEATISATVQGTTASQTITVTDTFDIDIYRAETIAIAGARKAALAIDVAAGGGGSKYPRLDVDWGDGAHSAVAAGSPTSGCNYMDACVELDHLYTRVGTYTAVLSAATSAPSSAVSETVTVKDLSGTWVNTVHNPSNGRDETRILRLSGSATLTGTYTHPEGNSESLSGSVTGNSISFASNSGTISWKGGFGAGTGDGINDDVSAFSTLEKGGSADGMLLTFTRQQ